MSSIIDLSDYLQEVTNKSRLLQIGFTLSDIDKISIYPHAQDILCPRCIQRVIEMKIGKEEPCYCRFCEETFQEWLDDITDVTIDEMRELFRYG